MSSNHDHHSHNTNGKDKNNQIQDPLTSLKSASSSSSSSSSSCSSPSSTFDLNSSFSGELSHTAYSSIPSNLTLQINTQHSHHDQFADQIASANSQPNSANSSSASSASSPVSPLPNFHHLLSLSPSPSSPNLQSHHTATTPSSASSAPAVSSAAQTSTYNPSSSTSSSSNRFNEPLAQQQATRINRVSSHQDLQSHASPATSSSATSASPAITASSSAAASQPPSAAQRALLPSLQSSVPSSSSSTASSSSSNTAATNVTSNRPNNNLNNSMNFVSSSSSSSNSGGFFSSLFSSNSRNSSSSSSSARAQQIPPLVTYMERLKRCHQQHLKNINQLSDLKAKFEVKSVEEIAQWNAWSQAPLAQLAANFYTIHMAYVNTLLGLEGRFMANIERHILVANAVCDHRYSEKMIEREMFSSVAEQIVRTPEEIDALFWPSDAEEIKNLCRSVGVSLKKVEAVHAQMSEKGKRRETLAERSKKLNDLIQKALTCRDSLEVDTFHHHPYDVKSQTTFNHLMCDQRYDEGKFIKQFMDFQQQHRHRMNNAALLSFINQLIKLIFKTYRFDERCLPIIRLYCDRLIFQRVPELMDTIIPKEEKEKSAKLAAKFNWLRTLTPQQLGVTEDLMPPNYQHTAYTPLYSPNGSIQSNACSPSSSSTATNNTINSSLHIEASNNSISNDALFISDMSASTNAAPASSSSSAALNHSIVFNEDNPLAPTPLHAASSSSSTSSNITSTSNTVRESSPALPPRQSSPSISSLPSQQPPLLTNINVAALSDLSFLTREETAPPPLQVVSHDFPYAEAINLLTELNAQLVPFDIFYRVVQSVRAVFTCAKKYMRANRIARAKAQNRQLAQDDPFAQFMTKLVDESSQEIKQLETQDQQSHSNSNATTNASPHSTSASSYSTDNHLTSNNPLQNNAPISAAAVISASTLPPVAHFYAPSIPPNVPTTTPSLAEREEEETPLNADDLFPLMIWLVIHSNVINIMIHLGNIDRFVPPDLKTFGDAGYCVSQIEAVLFYLQDLTQENLGKSRRNFEEEEETHAAEQHSDKKNNNTNTLKVDTNRNYKSQNGHSFHDLNISSPAQIVSSPSSTNLISPNL